ncbi:MAG: hypothetical protein Q8M54_01300 [Desulfobaccales bacterium]|nr:hypothetical protein [Desulfobaccales bacterium]
MNCPKCNRLVDPATHGDLIFDGQVWCAECRVYGWELTRPRDFQEIKAWGPLIWTAFGYEPVLIEQDLKSLTDPTTFRKETSVLLAEADHRQRKVLFYPPGCRLSTLCHELAHIFTSQDHTPEWAATFARLVAWVRSQLANNHGPQGFSANLPIYPNRPRWTTSSS